MPENIDSGTVVQLKSGGPKMTVDHPQRGATGQDTGRYWCQWFEGTRIKRQLFHGDALRIIDDEPSV